MSNYIRKIVFYVIIESCSYLYAIDIGACICNNIPLVYIDVIIYQYSKPDSGFVKGSLIGIEVEQFKSPLVLVTVRRLLTISVNLKSTNGYSGGNDHCGSVFLKFVIYDLYQGSLLLTRFNFNPSINK